jgi:beta-galactosidase/beta-glucuronidase
MKSLTLFALFIATTAAVHLDAYPRSPIERTRIASLRETSRLRDPSPAGSAPPQYLDGEDWIVSSADSVVNIAGYVPGDLITDLQIGGVIGDPIYDQNWLLWAYANESAPLWDSQPFTYTKTFDADASLLTAGVSAQLTFDGVKMAADVALNGISLGFTNDMFLRTVFDATAALRAKNNILTVTFTNSLDVRNQAGRWPACSGGW